MHRCDASLADAADLSDAVVSLHGEIDRGSRRLQVLHGARLRCAAGCASCCVDELSVFPVEVARIRRHHGALLAEGAPHAEGGCAFLDADGACRIYADRPYVCRTQGLPLRWTEEDAEGLVELRDICPLNEPGESLEDLRAEDCWTLGPVEEKLAALQIAASTPPDRLRLRSLFRRTAAK